jgi:hypothetical protein
MTQGGRAKQQLGVVWAAAGVAYVKYDRASAAALAIESLHEVTLNDGQGPRLKVILADSPHTRYHMLQLAGPYRRSACQIRMPLRDSGAAARLYGACMSAAWLRAGAQYTCR